MSYNKSVIVTGAGGLIGKAVCTYLHANNLDILAIYHTQPLEEMPWKCMVSDIENDTSALPSLAEGHVVHCAANIPKSGTYEHLKEVAGKNKIIDDNILDFVKKNNSTLIYTSGTSVYGFEQTEKINEDFIVRPLEHPYFNQKINSEKLFYNELNNVIVLRISAPYNPCMNANTVLKLFIIQALNNENITFHGTGARQQDFIHTNDISSAILSCIKVNNIKDVFNIATGSPISMKSLAERIVSKIPGCKSEILPSGFADPQENFKAKFDITKAEKELGWQPLISLSKGIDEWIKHLTP